MYRALRSGLIRRAVVAAKVLSELLLLPGALVARGHLERKFRKVCAKCFAMFSLALSRAEGSLLQNKAGRRFSTSCEGQPRSHRRQAITFIFDRYFSCHRRGRSLLKVLDCPVMLAGRRRGNI